MDVVNEDDVDEGVVNLDYGQGLVRAGKRPLDRCVAVPGRLAALASLGLLEGIESLDSLANGVSMSCLGR